MSFWKHDHVEQTSTGISIESVREDRPEFKRVYTARLDERATIKVEIKWYGFVNSGLYKTGELTQPNGRWVLFDPDTIADKILDPTLVPLVEACVKEIYALDATFRNPEPTEFTDNRGVRWRALV